jgi:hypothetical protein
VRHTPSEHLVLAETVSEIDQSISLLHDESSDDSESNFEPNLDLDELGDDFDNLWAGDKGDNPADLNALSGDNLSTPGIGDRDRDSPTNDEPTSQSHPGTGLYREYHPYLTGKYLHISTSKADLFHRYHLR